jgi:hypothetical protein
MAKGKSSSSELPDQIVTVEIEGQDFTLRLNDFGMRMKIDPVNLEDELREQSGFYFWVARLSTVAGVDAERRKQELDLFLAERTDEIRDELEGAGKKVPGVEAISAKAKTEREYVDRLDAYLDAKQNAGLMNEARMAAQMRSYMILALARGQQQEHAGAEE